MALTKSKRAKRIIRSLSIAQQEDQVLGAFTPLLIRYNLLHNYHRCIQVSVDLGWPSDRLPIATSYNAMPNFLRSQLDAQKITDGTRLWSQVVPILTFIQSTIRRLGKSRGYPTLFVWHSRENHRSYFFFAFVEFKMVSKTYSIRELVRMKNSSASKEFYDRLYDKLRRDSSFGDIFRMPSDRALPLIREEDAEVAIGPDRSAMKPLQAKPTAARQLDGTDYEWKYRGRSESEEGVAHPICSPAGLAAQKDEGFQKFYKAVVSPTHVRVTAGGRIVPNTRGVPSPTAKLARDRLNGDTRGSARPDSCGNSENAPYPIPQLPYGAFPPMIHGIPSAMAPALAPGMIAGHSPYPMIPWPMAHAYGMMAHPHMVPSTGQPPSTAMASVPLQLERQSDPGNSENPSPIQLSPPEHFDRNRPFYYNGQWMMPPGAVYSPGATPHVPGFPVGMPGQPIMGQKHPVYPWMHLPALRSETSSSSQASSLPNVPGYTGVLHMPTSSILQSEITKKQLAHLRQHLKNAEDQLLYNKHQIDEKATEQSIENLRHQIKLFEHTLEKALAKEDSLKPKGDDTADLCNSPGDGHRSKRPSAGDQRVGTETRSASSQEDMPQVRNAKNFKGKERMSSPLPSGSSGAQPAPLKSALKKPHSMEPVRKASSLPVSAALAPPFQPRTDGTASAPVTDSSATSGESLMLVDSTYLATDAHGLTSKPYLVGAVRPGCDPAMVTDADYIYGRDLTEDELRARHLFWGNTPRSLQKGLPKFDGKDFYPPSPVRDTVTGPKSRRRMIGSSQLEHGLPKTKADSDPFESIGRHSLRHARQLTQSDQLPGLQSPMVASPASTNVSPAKRNVQPDRSYDDFRKALGDAFPSSCNDHKEKSSPDSGDDSSILFKGRRNASITKFVPPGTNDFKSAVVADLDLRGKSSHEILTSMFKKGKSSGVAVPVTVSSTTAQGVLPHYAGHATASLTPNIASTPGGRKDLGRKAAETGDAGCLGPDEVNKVENLHPNSPHYKDPIPHGSG
ncbi:actin filament organization protein app1 [Purpureocillium lavendulum]|uniref:Actin filament organization protein app1 n=1 Tax=Purpureocillium lavendulum TaxID=1247861 RepID=A0AB34FSG5_9HYPO|nr:actin filament organization protein app1 [Purpureocillium lavendulum]